MSGAHRSAKAVPARNQNQPAMQLQIRCWRLRKKGLRASLDKRISATLVV